MDKGVNGRRGEIIKREMIRSREKERYGLAEAKKE